MNLKAGIGKSGVALAALVAIAMCVLSLLFHPVEIARVRYGLCLPSPDSWDFNPVGSWVINTLLIGMGALLLFLINKNFNFIRTTEPVLPSLFMIMTASSPWFTETINTSMILCIANILCLGIIFESYDEKNATRSMFILGVVEGAGSMVQYAFLPMACVYFLWALFMRVLRLKETLAFVAGMICPYWILLGGGFLKFSDLHFPTLTSFFVSTDDKSDLFFLFVGIALAAGAGFLTAMINFMKIYAGNSRVNAMNLCVYTLGIASVICILVDYDNLPAYVLTLYMTTAIQIANICAVWRPAWPWLVTAVPSVLFMAIFAASLIV